jgi:O-methyltransferase
MVWQETRSANNKWLSMPIRSIMPIAHWAANEWHFRRLHSKYRDYTMIPERLYAGNLHLTARIAGIEGAVVECGTWRGGMIAGIADVLGSSRRYYLCDSFEGLPPAKEIDGAEAKAWQANTTGPQYFNNCAASDSEARSAMSMSSAIDYRIVKGWFDQTLSRLTPEPIALLRLDADWYDSTKCVLDNLTNHMVPGGLIIIDDYRTWPGCTAAVNEFAAAKQLRVKRNLHGVHYLVV